MTPDDKAPEWTPARTAETADVPEEEFCGYDACRHHMDAHDYTPRPGKDTPCTECPGGWCVR